MGKTEMNIIMFTPLIEFNFSVSHNSQDLYFLTFELVSFNCKLQFVNQ